MLLKSESYTGGVYFVGNINGDPLPLLHVVQELVSVGAICMKKKDNRNKFSSIEEIIMYFVGGFHGNMLDVPNERRSVGMQDGYGLDFFEWRREKTDKNFLVVFNGDLIDDTKSVKSSVPNTRGKPLDAELILVRTITRWAKEAKLCNDKVVYVLGNHEIQILRDDLTHYYTCMLTDDSPSRKSLFETPKLKTAGTIKNEFISCFEKCEAVALCVLDDVAICHGGLCEKYLKNFNDVGKFPSIKEIVDAINKSYTELFGIESRNKILLSVNPIQYSTCSPPNYVHAKMSDMMSVSEIMHKKVLRFVVASTKNKSTEYDIDFKEYTTLSIAYGLSREEKYLDSNNHSIAFVRYDTKNKRLKRYGVLNPTCRTGLFYCYRRIGNTGYEYCFKSEGEIEWNRLKDAGLEILNYFPDLKKVKHMLECRAERKVTFENETFVIGKTLVFRNTSSKHSSKTFTLNNMMVCEHLPEYNKHSSIGRLLGFCKYTGTGLVGFGPVYCVTKLFPLLSDILISAGLYGCKIHKKLFRHDQIIRNITYNIRNVYKGIFDKENLDKFRKSPVKYPRMWIYDNNHGTAGEILTACKKIKESVLYITKNNNIKATNDFCKIWEKNVYYMRVDNDDLSTSYILVDYTELCNDDFTSKHKIIEEFKDVKKTKTIDGDVYEYIGKDDKMLKGERTNKNNEIIIGFGTKENIILFVKEKDPNKPNAPLVYDTDSVGYNLNYQ